MKRYEKLLKVLEAVDEKYIQLSNARDDVYEQIQKCKDTGTKQELERYDDKLAEQQHEVTARENALRKQLEFIEAKNYEWSVMFNYDGLYYRYKVMDLEELPRFFAWLMMMNEEVADV
jgi:hypothetical protein